MKCCVVPTTSTLADPPAAAHAAQTTLQAILFSSILKPLAAGLGPAADVAVESVVQHLFVGPRP